MSGTYTVKKGDCLYNIAKSHGVTLGELLAANPKFTKSHGRDPNLIYPAETVTIPDRSKFCSASDLSSGKVICPKKKKSILTEKEAQALFDTLAKEPHIPYDYPVDCCYTRAHEMCRIMKENGVESQKYWLFDKDWGTSGVTPSLQPKDKTGKAVTFPDSSGTPRPVKWVYHVAPIVKVRKSDGTVEDRVMDPSISDEPLTTDEWSKIMGDPAGAYAETSSSDAYFQNKKHGYYQGDSMGAKTKKQLEKHRKNRDANLKAAGKGP
jgi:hypothetical protein